MDSGVERARFAELQAAFAASYPRLVADPKAPRTVVVLPSLSLDAEVMARISGVHHYEERMLGMLFLLRLPRTRVVFVTSQPVPEPAIDYYLGLLAGVPHAHARARLHLVACHDGSRRPLAAKVLERPRLVERLRELIPDPAAAHLSCFTVSAAERALAVRLGIPIYGCDPDLAGLGSKSGSRKVFREAGIALPAGFEDLADEGAIAAALTELKRGDPGLRRAVVKLDEGFSGEGNAVFDFAGAPEGSALRPWVSGRLPQLAFEARGMDWEAYRAKLDQMGAVVEAFVEGAQKRSPSAQFRVEPDGTLDLVSTHDQVLGGPSGQIFLGCEFPADPAYRLAVQAAGAKAAGVLRDRGVLGRFAVDFVSVRRPSGWEHLAIEVNLRKGGTTHPNLMLQFLTDGSYEPATGRFVTPTGGECCYHASDNVEAEAYRGLTPEDLVDLAVLEGLHFDRARQEGVVFHLIGALSEFGKLGMVSVGPTMARARELFRATLAVLDRETGNRSGEAEP
jgi:hypothetical protein